MTQWKHLAGGATLAVLLGTGAVRADVTAEEVWKSWVDYYTDLGATVASGSEARDGDTLVITDTVISAESKVPGEEGSFSSTLKEVRLKDLGDGRVEMTLSGDIPLTFAAKPAEGDALDIELLMTHTGLTMIASGTAGDMTYDFSSPAMNVKTQSFAVNGAPADVSFDVAMTGNSGKYHMTTGAGRTLSSEFAAENVNYTYTFTDPESQGAFSGSGTMAGLTGSSSFAMPEGVDMQQLDAALQAGARMDGSFSYGAGSGTGSFTESGETMNFTSAGEGGALNFAMSKDGIAYGASAKAMQMTMTGAAIPVPVDFSIADMLFDLAMPVSKSDEEQPFKLVLKMIDLKVSDTLWGMFDPAGQLPHDPATVIVDATGSAKMLVNVFDPAVATSSEAPGTVEKLDLNELKVSAAGAELTGNGAVTFNNAGPVPMPVGAVDLRLAGANKLMDTLVAMGLLPEDQVMGARMMMGMFAVPSGDDVLTSKIEFKEDGGIYANGQRIQ